MKLTGQFRSPAPKISLTAHQRLEYAEELETLRAKAKTYVETNLGQEARLLNRQQRRKKYRDIFKRRQQCLAEMDRVARRMRPVEHGGRWIVRVDALDMDVVDLVFVSRLGIYIWSINLLEDH